MTIRKRLALWYSGLLALIIIIFSVVVIAVSRVTILQTVDNLLSDAAHQIVDVLDPVFESETGIGSDSLMPLTDDEATFDEPGVSVQIWRIERGAGEPSLTLLYRSSDLANWSTPLDPNYIDSESLQYNSVSVANRPVRVITHPYYNDAGEELGVVQVATPMRTIVNSNDQLLVITLISAVICIGVSVGLGLWLSDHLLKPIERITKTAATITAAQDLSTRIQWDGPPDELGKLTDAFNHTLERLEHLFELQQRFISDVSHELRTPLTSILGNLELIERYGMDQESLDVVYRESARMSRMVNDLLMLTRAEFGEVDVDFFPVDLDVLALEIYEQVLVIAKDRRLSIVLERIDPVQIDGSADRLRQLLLNLLSNAVKFTTDGGHIALSVYPQGNNAVIEVSDTGMGISEEDLQHIFDRFYQVDMARTHTDEADGAGLGLSIARWIVDIHKGEIDVRSKVGKGTHFRITLPKEQAVMNKRVSWTGKPEHPITHTHEISAD